MLPTSRKELDALGYDNVDVILFSGDAYVDHPSFGPAVIGRVLEAQGYRVAIVPQPNWRDDLRDFTKLGKPRLFFGVSAGNMDSMVNHYTAARRLRSNDAYTPGGNAGMRPDYAVTVYTRILRQLFPGVPVIIGGIEASLRRLTHYDYWKDELFPSVLADSGADYLVYGMGERPIVELAAGLRAKAGHQVLREIPQIAYLRRGMPGVETSGEGTVILPSYSACRKDKAVFARHFRMIEEQANRENSPVLIEPQGNENDEYVVVNPPFPPATTEELDAVYDLPFTYKAHWRYKNKQIPALDMIQFSVCLHRGCFGGCSFCTIAAHQGKQISSRSTASVLREIERLSALEDFKGHLTDLGGPTANMYRMHGIKREQCAVCRRTSCLFPNRCRNLDHSHAPLLALYKTVRDLPQIKKATIGSGIRYDLFLDRNGFLDNESESYFNTLLEHHVSGRLKVAPEHTEDNVLKYMHKPSFELYRKLSAAFYACNKNRGLKQQLIPYFISSHPGCTLKDMERLSAKFAKEGIKVEQVQDFTPTPMTKSSVMYYSGIDPDTGEKIFAERNMQKKALQKESFFR